MRNQQTLPHSLTPEEQTLLQLYRQLDEGTRQYLSRATEALVQGQIRSQEDERHG